MGKLEEKKRVKLVHPNSRKAAALVKKKIRTARRDTKKQQGHQRLRRLAERLVWFRDNLDQQHKHYTVEEIHQLIESYIVRDSAEVEVLRVKNARAPAGHRRPQSRLDALLATQRAETLEYSQGGFECADLTDEEALLYLRAWDGQIKLVPQIKTRKFIRGRLAAAEAADGLASQSDTLVTADAAGSPEPPGHDSEMSDG